MDRIGLRLRGKNYQALLDQAIDIAISLDFDGRQPRHFGAPAATATPLGVGEFVGDVRQGGSCNCEEYRFVPHCVGTHTECVGHITTQRVSVHDCLSDSMMVALVISVAPEGASACAEKSEPPAENGDALITAASLSAADMDTGGVDALVIRTLPNDLSKRHRDHGATPAPFLTIDAVNWINDQQIEHLLVDTPSLDRGHDRGRLAAHRLFWGLDPGQTDYAKARFPHRTITEMIYVPESVADGEYLLNLQVAAFASDAAPSRPRLFPLVPA